MAKKKKEITDDATALEDKRQDILSKFEYYTREWQPIRDEADEDMRYVAGDPFSDTDKRLRADAMRPTVVVDELHQFYNQVINDWKVNPRSVHFTPKGFNTNDKTADLYNDLWREIQYRSKAVRAYCTALENCIYRSYGWVRLTTKRENIRSKNHEIWVEAVPNPNMIVADPDALDPTSADAKGLFCYQSLSEKEFTKKFPDAKMRDFSPGLMRGLVRDQPSIKPWVKADRQVQLAEFWEVQQVTRRLTMLKPEQAKRLLKPEILADPDEDLHYQLMGGGPIGVFASDELIAMPADDDILSFSDVEDRKVVQYLTNGLEILEVNPWMGKYLPFASCFGKVLYLDHGGTLSRQILSMTRLARQPYLSMCYLASVELELIGMMPKFPYFVPKGSLDNANLTKLSKSNHEPVTFVEFDDYDQRTPNARRGPPIRNPYEARLAEVMASKEGMRRSIQSAMGITPLPTAAQRNNEKTGAALGKIESQGQKGAFHFPDAADAMVEQIGIAGEDLTTPVYDTARTLATRNYKGDTIQVRVNDANDTKAVSTKGRHQVTVTSAPAESSAREAAQHLLTEVLSSPNLPLAVQNPIAGKTFAMAIRLQTFGPMGDEVANLFDPKSGGMSPEMMQGQLQQAGAKLQELQTAIQQLLQERQADVIKTTGMLKGKQMEVQARLIEKQMDDATKITVAMIGAKTKTDISHNEARDEALALGVKVVHEERMADMNDASDAHRTGATHQHEVHRAVQDHIHNIAAMLTDHGHKMEQILAAPEPEQAS